MKELFKRPHRGRLNQLQNPEGDLQAVKTTSLESNEYQCSRRRSSSISLSVHRKYTYILHDYIYVNKSTYTYSGDTAMYIIIKKSRSSAIVHAKKATSYVHCTRARGRRADGACVWGSLRG